MTNRVNPINIEEKIDSGLLQISTNFLFDEIQNDNINIYNERDLILRDT